MRRNGFVSIRTRLVLLVVVALAPALGLFLTDYLEHRKHEYSEAQGRAIEIVRFTAGDQEATIEDARMLVVSLSHTRVVRSGDIPACRTLIAGLRPHGDVFGDLALARADGAVVVGDSAAGSSANVAAAHWFQRVSGARGGTVIEYQEHGISGRPGLVVASAIPRSVSRNRLIVYVWRALPPAGYLRHATLPARSTLVVIDANGIVLARNGGPSQTADPSRLPGRVVAAAVSSPGPGTLEAAGPDGVARLWGFAPVTADGARPAYAVISIPADVAFAHMNRTLVRTVCLLAIALAMVAVLTWLGSDALILRRMRGLLRTTETLAAGELGARTGVASGQDEIGRLAASFDQMAAALQRSSADLERSLGETRRLARRLQSVSEERRARVAQEVDDELGQPMAAARMELAHVSASLKKVDARGELAGIASQIRAVDDLLSASLQAVQRIGTLLRPPVLDALGLAAAVEWQAREFEERTQTPCRVDVDESVRLPAGNPATALFRILQEALRNVERHAQAAEVRVKLSRTPGRVELEIRDDGVGIPQEAIDAGESMGLIEMRERALAFGGHVEVTRIEGGGTSVKAILACPCTEPCAAARLAAGGKPE